MVKRPLTPAQEKALDRDHDGHAGGSPPHARAPQAGEDASEPAVTGDPPVDPPPPAEAEAEPEPELVEAAGDPTQEPTDAPEEETTVQPEAEAPAAAEAPPAADDADPAVEAAAPAPGQQEGEAPASVDGADAGGDPSAVDEPAGPAEVDEPPLNTEAQNDATPTAVLAAELADELAPAADETQPGSEAAFVQSQENASITATAPIAPAPLAALTGGHLEALGDMAANRYGVYAYPPEGFALQPGGPYHQAGVIRELIDAGLAHYEESGGRDGSAKITPGGLAAYKQARQAALSEA